MIYSLQSFPTLYWLCFYYIIFFPLVSLLRLTVKNLPAMQETWVWMSGSGSSLGEGNGCPLQYSCLENSMGYSPWAHKESDTTEWLTHMTHTFLIVTILFSYYILDLTSSFKMSMPPPFLKCDRLFKNIYQNVKLNNDHTCQENILVTFTSKFS